jgi:hypothetical protein
MIGEKSDPKLRRFDRYVCLNCGTVIATERPPSDEPTA